MPLNHVENIAIVGAGGRSGKYIAEALLQTGIHNVTAITRPSSTNSLPSGLDSIKHVDYSDHRSLVTALRNQDVLIVTMSHFAPPESQKQLVDAAVEAGVQWILPNEWGIDLDKEGVGRDTGLGERLLEMRRYIEDVGKRKLNWIGVACSWSRVTDGKLYPVWYEFSLAGTSARYGFDFEKKKKLTLFDSGTTKINTTTWSQVGRAVASLLALPIRPENETPTEDHVPCLSNFANRSIYISSFLLSQRDMLASVLRVTGDREADWTIEDEGSGERFERASKLFKDEGDVVGLIMMLYTRVIYPDGSGDFQTKLHNEVLGVPSEDLDEATKAAVQRALLGDI